MTEQTEGTAIEPRRAAELETLAGEIRQEIGLADSRWNDALDHAIKAGEKLIEAKGLVEHGEWGHWLHEHLPDVPQRTARRYMQLARNSRHVTHLPTVREAIAAVSTPRDNGHVADSPAGGPQQSEEFVDAVGHLGRDLARLIARSLRQRLNAEGPTDPRVVDRLVEWESLVAVFDVAFDLEEAPELPHAEHCERCERVATR